MLDDLAQRLRDMVAKCEPAGYPRGDDYPLRDSRAGELMWEASVLLDEAEKALRETEAIQPKSLEMIVRHGFVFARDIAHPIAELDEVARWEKLAFSLYTDLCEANTLARAALVGFSHTQSAKED